MTSITCYDVDANEISQLADELDVTEAALVEALLEAVHDCDIDLEDYV